MTKRTAARGGREKEGGVILVMALFIIALFTVLVLEFNYSTRVEYHIAATCRDDFLALNIARAGVSETVALLRDDRLAEIEEKEREDEEKGHAAGTTDASAPQSFTQQVIQSKPQAKGAPRDIPFPDHYGEDWARERFQEPFGDGFLSLKVIDETGKININTLVKEQTEIRAQTPTPTPCADCTPTEAAETPKPPPRAWGQVDPDKTGEEDAEEKSAEEPVEPEPVRYVVDKKVEKDIMRLIEALDVRGVDEEKVTAAIVDWMDSNDEGDWEESDGAGSPVKNAPLDVLSELLMVKGVTGDLFFGPGRPETLDLDLEMAQKGGKHGGTGLRDCLTVFARGKVNVNTAPPEVLTALLEEANDSLVKEIVAYTRKEHFKDLAEFEEKIGENVPASFRARIGVGSDCVQIVSRGRVNDSVKQLRVFVSRDDEAVARVLFWRVER